MASTLNPAVIIRRASAADVDEIGRISRSTGQPDTDSGADPRYAHMLLAEATVMVAERNEQALGFGAVRTGPLATMLTDLFVDPREQGGGVGRALLDALWPDEAAPRRVTFSSRHPNALPLYVRSGLHPVWPLLYLAGDPQRLQQPPAHEVQFVDAETAAMAEGTLVGGSCAADYRYWVEALGARALVVTGARGAEAVGVCGSGRLLHLACADDTAAADVLCAAARVAGGASVSLCVPGPHPATPALLRSGFRIDDYDIAMATPDVALPSAWVYSPALG